MVRLLMNDVHEIFDSLVKLLALFGYLYADVLHGLSLGRDSEGISSNGIEWRVGFAFLILRSSLDSDDLIARLITSVGFAHRRRHRESQSESSL